MEVAYSQRESPLRARGRKATTKTYAGNVMLYIYIKKCCNGKSFVGVHFYFVDTVRQNCLAYDVGVTHIQQLKSIIGPLI